ncbi:MAG: isoprenylcysteine carboxylmethyltransferase family protein [Methylomonas sp.]|nr:isoprenylcysteine carboxylmethyltransferase family protein [Methylomonas sp.]
MTSVRIIWLLLGLFWVVAEIRLARKAEKNSRDIIDGERRSQGWLWLSVIVSVCLAMVFKTLAWLPIRIDYLPRQWLALLLFSVGIGLRYWAVLKLGRFFTTHVLIQNQHRLITDGPYRWIRHPAYTGLLIALSGAGLAMGDVFALLLLTVVPFFAFKSRIAIEEKKLIEQLGGQYLDYSNKTYKLLPLLY